jgi:hypothetical protein
MVGSMGQVITANRLKDGTVVFLGTEFNWVEQIADARLFNSAEAVAAGLAATKKDEVDNLVVEIYAIEVSDKAGAVVPVRLREAIRASGPTIHPEHGKSAQANRG